jgi:hypothetical protein
MTGARQAESPLILLTAASMLLCFQMICIFHLMPGSTKSWILVTS